MGELKVGRYYNTIKILDIVPEHHRKNIANIIMSSPSNDIGDVFITVKLYVAIFSCIFGEV